MTSNKDQTQRYYIRQISINLLRPQQLFFKSLDHFGSLISRNSEYMVMRREK
jgi:hypothetical protein